MKVINIVFSTVNRSQHIIRYGQYFKEALLALPDIRLHLVEDADHIDQILERIGCSPDFIFFDDFTMNHAMHGLEQVEIPKGVLYWDIHRDQDELRTFVHKNHIDLVFSFYRDSFLSWFPDLKQKFRWLPNYVNL
jgi:hypothetical protein